MRLIESGYLLAAILLLAITSAFADEFSSTWIDRADSLATHVSPPPDKTMQQSPPDFRWPGMEQGVEYEITLTAPSGDITVLRTKNNWINWPRSLAPGSYTWRIKPLKTGAIPSAIMHFTIAADAQSFVIPTPDALLNTVTHKSRPRGFPIGTAKLQLLAALSGDRSNGLQMLLERVEADMKRALVAEPLQLAALSGNQRIRPQTLDLPSLVEPDARQAIEAGFAYIATGKKIFAREAIRRALNMAEWDPRGPTGFKTYDLVSRRIAWSLALVFDGLHDELTEDERVRIAAAIEIRAADMIADLVGPNHRLENYPYDSHGWETLGFAAAIVTLIAGDVPQANEWFKQIVPWYFNSISPWGGEDGGFANGTGYGVWVFDSLQVWDVLEYATGVDVTQKPWVKGLANYFMYFLPPGTPGGVFGDGAEAPIQMSYIKAFSSRLRSRAFTDYANRLTGIFPSYLGLLFAPADRVPLVGEEFSKLPAAAVFPSIGWAAMLSNLADANRVAVYFKSSPYGSISHSHADQNSFVVYANGKKLLVDSGYYDWYGSPHWKEWYSQTLAKNAVTFDGGAGQLTGQIDARGKITTFRHTQSYDIVSGNATDAYDGTLTRSVRTIVYLRPNTIVVFDSLKSEAPRKWEWNFHTVAPIVSQDDGMLKINSSDASLCIQMLQPAETSYSESANFTVAPNPALHWPSQWHGRYTAVPALSTATFITLLSIGCEFHTVSKIEHQGAMWQVRVDNQMTRFNEAGGGIVTPAFQ